MLFGSDERNLTVVDEFTCVVERKVARVGSYAVQRAVRKLGRKFVAVTCHDDILEWLEPDWTFCTNDMAYTSTRGKLRRPSIRVDIGEVKGYWRLFSKYHYMNHNLLGGSKQYVAFIDGEPVAFCAMTLLVHHKIRDAMRLHRLVVLPDYQGVGIGGRLLNHVCEIFHTRGQRVFARFSHPALIALMAKDDSWTLTHNVSRAARHGGTEGLAKSGSHGRLTTGWEYKPSGRL